MKICIIGKYPPIAGGVSAHTYWFARALGQQGHQVHIVTNAFLVEEMYREQLNLDKQAEQAFYQPKNVFVHNLPEEDILSVVPIPHTDAMVVRLANLAVEVVKKYDCEIIHSIYTLPYGFAGYLSKMFTGRRQLLQTAGSDARKIFSRPSFRTAFIHLFKNVDGVITLGNLHRELINLGIAPGKFYAAPFYQVNPNCFNSDAKPINLGELGIGKLDKNIPLLLVACKTSRNKGVFELVTALEKIKEIFFILFVTNGKLIGEFREHLGKYPNVLRQSKIIPFLPPWKMPGLIKRASCVIHLENQFPVKEHQPVLYRESFATGACTLLSEEIAGKFPFKNSLKDGYNTFIVNPLKMSELSTKLSRIIKNKAKRISVGKNAYKTLREKVTHFEEYINGRFKAYDAVLSGVTVNPLNHSLLPNGFKNHY
ncbi:MAG: glycosyltransferase family 4 protein [Planctomycetes bacterium]|nr:glycosyltransferase family 4 protein [Planctomycetota bacterium]